MMTREDMLRELELLPAWQLRASLAEPVIIVEKLAKIEPIKIVVEKSAYEKPLSFSEQALPTVMVNKELLSNILNDVSVTQNGIYQCASSEDNDFLFIMPLNEISADTAILKRNIWRAMRLNMQDSVSQNLNAIEFAKHKVIITMGENIAQHVLATEAPLSELRGQVHQYQNRPLIITFEATYLMQNAQYKAQAWADLCSSMQVLSDLKLAK